MVNRMERASFYWAFMAVVGVFLGTQAIAKACHELHSPSDEHLSQRISEFEENLKQNGDDYESVKGLGIEITEKDPNTYEATKREGYENLAELFQNQGEEKRPRNT